MKSQNNKTLEALKRGIGTCLQRVPALRGFWDLEKTALRKIHVSGTVGGPLLMQKSPTCAYISQNRGSVIRGSENHVSGGHPLLL